MNKNKLKSYAPQARRDFIQIVRQRADLLGLTKPITDKIHVEGEVCVIEGRPYPKRYAELHRKLVEKIRAEGLQQLIERVAYSWFNRFAALRFMEVNGFLNHGYRVLSNRDAGKADPEILAHATDVELAGLDREAVLELKLAGNKDAELYKRLLIAQCNELNRAMPFLFERINDETEILLPDNLLHTDSVIRKIVSAIDEEDWREVEIIGWLYQFYISEKKDEVIGKTVKSEDIPAATQLFTPNWIVKYMTQNSLGRLWLEANPQSQLAQQMEFYIEPSEPPVSAGGQSLNPEEIRVLDPACGSGHILVEAYELLKAIYTERGYSSPVIPFLILRNNLFGLDIDERAVQLASFALLMKARRDDRGIFDRIAEAQIGSPGSQIPNILAIPDSSHLNAKEIADMFCSQTEPTSEPIPIRDSNLLFSEMETQPSLLMSGESRVESQEPSASRTTDHGHPTTDRNVVDLLELFSQGHTLGSLIRIPHGFGAVLDKLEKAIEAKRGQGNFLEQIAARELEPFVRAALMLANKYDCVIANPPYMGGKGMNAELKAFAAKNFPDSKSDLFAMFIEREMEHIKANGYAAFVTPFVWMFISSYEQFRTNLIEETPISSLIQLEYNAFEPACVPVCTFTLHKNAHITTKGEFIKLSDFRGHQNQAPKTLEAINNPSCGWRFQASTADFEKIPGSPIAYWASDKIREVFVQGKPFGDISTTRAGMITGNNEKFVRLWFEINKEKFGINYENRDKARESKRKWFPYNKGGEFRKWFGNNEAVINWENDGFLLRTTKDKNGKIPAHAFNEEFIFLPSITWSEVSSSKFGVRLSDKGFLFDSVGNSAFLNPEFLKIYSGFLCSNIAYKCLMMLNPTMHFQKGNIASLPILESRLNKIESQVDEIVEEAVSIARADWDSFETSWDFARLPILDFGFWIEKHGRKPNSVEEAWDLWRDLTEERMNRMQELETENNRLFIEAYGLEDELSPEVPLEQITLARADAEKDTRRLLSYFIGCLMGRYSLDAPGLIYADAGGKGFDPSRYQTFPADDDGIVPITDIEWFPQDAARQFEKFVRAVWGGGSLSANLSWIATQLGGKSGESPLDTIRRYFSTSFFKDHLQTYKKRPIYWLFSSGKNKAFECLVYLHRYNENTLPRMRHEYVMPLMGKLEAQIETLAGKVDVYETRSGGLIESATTTAERNRLTKQREALQKKKIELAAFDDQLRHYSDLRISLDLDDGVKVNYGKFGDLLAEVKTVTGK